MADLTSDQINDLIIFSQKQLGKYKWEDLTSDIQEYIALPRIFKRKKKPMNSGTSIQWNIKTDLSGATRHAGMYSKDRVAVVDVGLQAEEGWAGFTSNYAIDHFEITQNMEPSRILNLLKSRRDDMALDQANFIEEMFWSKPTGPTDENKYLGLFYWLTYGGDSAAAGFTGGDPSGFPAGCGGILSTAQSRWQNWSSVYTETSKDDLIKKAREGSVKTAWKPPIQVPRYGSHESSRAWYTVYSVLEVLERSLEAQNDNLGNDVAAKDGMTMLRRAPVEYVPWLDQNYATEAPLVGVDWNAIEPVFASGWFMVERASEKAPGQHTVSVVHNDTKGQLIAHNRRKHMYFQKAA